MNVIVMAELCTLYVIEIIPDIVQVRIVMSVRNGHIIIVNLGLHRGHIAICRHIDRLVLHPHGLRGQDLVQREKFIISKFNSLQLLSGGCPVVVLVNLRTVPRVSVPIVELEAGVIMLSSAMEAIIGIGPLKTMRPLIL
jgi:hypothetical protein